MKKIKITTIIFGILLGMFLFLDNKTYYYGFGKGFLSLKLPYFIKPHYRGTDLGNTGFALMDNEVDVIDNIHPVYIINDQKIKIKNFLGYGFNKKIIVVEIIDSFNKKKYLKIQNDKELNFIFEELKFMPEDLRYIDLDKNVNYFKNFNSFIYLFVKKYFNNLY